MDRPLASLPDGYTIRPARREDFPELVNLVNLCFEEMAGRGMLTLSDIERDLTVPGFELETDSRLVLSPGGRIVACQDVWAIVDPPVHPFVWGRVHPEHRGRGIGTHLLGWAVERARDACDRVPDGIRVSATASNLGGWEPGRALLEAAGFGVYRHSLDMRIDLAKPPPAAPAPDGIGIRTYRHPEEAEAVFRAAWEGFRDHFGRVEEPYETALERFTHNLDGRDDLDPDLWFLATEGEEICGICLCRPYNGPDREAGYVESLAVRGPWRRRGVARALLAWAFAEYRRRGRAAVELSVDAQSLTGAVALYEKAGMSVHRRYDVFELELRPGREIARTQAG